MKVAAECIPCFLTASLRAMEKGGWPEDRRKEELLGLLPLLGSLDHNKTPAENASILFHQLAHTMGGVNPFKGVKEESNKSALGYLPRLRERLSQSADRLETALRFAVAGNVVDMGIFDDYDLEGALKESLVTEFVLNDYAEFKERTDHAGKLLIIGDNSGEVVIDRVLVETLIAAGKEVTYGVKGGFVLNDSTLDDAVAAGMVDTCRVITNGNNFVGTIPEKCSEQFLQAYRDADLVITKGQGNFYTLEGTEFAGNKTFFLFKVKCSAMAKYLGVEEGALIFAQNKVAL